MASDRQGKVTDEHRAEARKLLAIWQGRKNALKSAGHGSQEAFGQAFDIGNQAAVGFFLNGKTALSLKAAVGFARGLQCQVGDFSPRLAALLDAVPRAPEHPPELSDQEAQMVRLMRALPSEALRAQLVAYAAGFAAASVPTPSPLFARKAPTVPLRKRA